MSQSGRSFRVTLGALQSVSEGKNAVIVCGSARGATERLERTLDALTAFHIKGVTSNTKTRTIQFPGKGGWIKFRGPTTPADLKAEAGTGCLYFHDGGE